MRYLILILILTACSPQKRFTRLIKKHPELLTTDSVKLIDTINVYTEKVVTDTVTTIERLKDTITLTKENLKVQVYTVKDSVYINGSCDTIFVQRIIERQIPVKYYEKKKSNWKLWLFIILSWVGFLWFAFKMGSR